MDYLQLNHAGKNPQRCLSHYPQPARNVLPPLRHTGHEGAKGEPDGRCRVATNEVAEVMSAEVDPTELDEQDIDRKYGYGGPPWKIGPRYAGKQVSQKSIGDARYHDVAAGKTPADGVTQGLGSWGRRRRKMPFKIRLSSPAAISANAQPNNRDHLCWKANTKAITSPIPARVDAFPKNVMASNKRTTQGVPWSRQNCATASAPSRK
jgi:hypothetical protein